MNYVTVNMAELDSEDSSDGTLVIDEPNYDSNIIEIIDDSDVEIIEIKDDSDETLTSNPSSSTTKNNSICKQCFRIFSTNNDLLNHVRKFKGRIGGCKYETKINTKTYTEKKLKSLASKPDVYKTKRGRPPKKKCQKLPVPESIPLCPELIPIIFEPAPSTNDICINDKNCTNDTDLPSVRQMLIEEIEPEHPCTFCDQIFRHYIGLVCHLNSEHNNVTSNKNDGKTSTKLDVKKKMVRKSVIKENKQIENHEPVSNTVDLTLLPDSKKSDSVLTRMKSYVYSINKDQVICVLCNIEFKNTKRALAHVEDKHIIDKFECGYCNMKFVYELKLRSHMAKRHKAICVYKCDKCSKMINKEECESHLEKCKANPVQIKREEVDNFNT